MFDLIYLNLVVGFGTESRTTTKEVEMPVIFVIGKNCKVSEAELEALRQKEEMKERQKAFSRIRRGTIFVFTRQNRRNRKEVVCCLASVPIKGGFPYVSAIVFSDKECISQILSGKPVEKENGRTFWLEDLRDLVIVKR